MIPAPELNDALFLDFDGTLVEIASEPALVEVGDPLLKQLDRLQQRLDGAIALVSGRPIEDLDALIGSAHFAAAGEHGAELRRGDRQAIERSSLLPEAALEVLREQAVRLPGTLLEVKTASASLHFRKAPQHQERVKQGMQALVATLPGYELLMGKMVVELKPRAVTKGTAIRALMMQPPFVGRRPVFIGDDTTDEPGFTAVNELAGLSIRVGEAIPSEANFLLGSVGDVHAWLAQITGSK
jgi:trehalose 6-phosphate phosphatase